MDKEFFLNAGMPPPLQFDGHPAAMPTWHSLSSAMEIQSLDCFLSPPPSSSAAAGDNFESALSSMVSSPAASTSGVSNDSFMIRELIGKLGNICNNPSSSSGGATPPPPAPAYISGGNCSTNNSSYSTPLSSPPKMGIPFMDHQLGNSIGLTSNLPAMPGDPGFAERAARFSSFGSRSFNSRTTQLGINNNNNNSNNNNNGEFSQRSNGANLGGIGKLQRVSSSPSLKAAGSQPENHKNLSPLQCNDRVPIGNSGFDQGEFVNSRENSSVSGQNQGGETVFNRKRKAAPKGKSKEAQSQSQSPLPTNSNRVGENEEESNAKRSKSEEGNGEAKTEENRGGDESKKQSNANNQKPPEPPKDYIHVRARRGQATDSHSLAERVRREKISERMKLLQDLVPGCNKVTGKALMLDEIINYVQSLQRQVEFLSMKLASVNPRLDFNNTDNLFSKDVIQPNGSMPHPMYPLDSLAPTLYGQPHQNSIPTGGSMAPSPCPMDHPLNPSLNHNHALQLQLPTLDAFPNGVPQLSSLCEGDLQSIVQMGYGQKENGFQSQPIQETNQTSLMKIEF